MDDYSIMEYYIIYGVNPDEYVDVSIYVLNFSHILLRKLNECGFKTIKNILFAKRSDLQHIRGFGIKQVEIFETELKRFFEGSNEYLKTNLATSFDEIEKSEKKYYQVFNVDPNEFIDKDISIFSAVNTEVPFSSNTEYPALQDFFALSRLLNAPVCDFASSHEARTR